MVNIGNYIRNQKDKFREQRINRANATRDYKTQELEKIRKERLVMEEKAKIENSINQERVKIKEAKGESTLMRLGKGLANTIDKNNHKPKKTSRRGFNNLGNLNSGSTGIDFGMGNGNKVNHNMSNGSPFNFGGGSNLGNSFGVGNNKPKPNKEKNIRIIINR